MIWTMTQYCAEIDRADFSQSTPAAQDYQPANHQAAPQKSMEELKRIFGRGRGQVRQEELHGHDHLAQELVPCKVASSARSRRIKVYIKGTLLTVNFFLKL